MNDKITEIKEALGKATLGPWTHFGEIIYGYTQTAVEPMICELFRSQDKDIIVNAPEYITYLLQLVETQHRYLERISVTFGEFECQRLAKEAMDKVKPI